MCTRDEVLTFSDHVLFPSIPVTYVITIEGSHRYNKLLQQLHEYRPTRTVIIVHHKSMSECKRPKWVTTPSLDLWQNNLAIAKRDPHSPVIILEDDVQFLPTVHEYAEHIDTLIANNECEVYSLGALPAISFPSSNKDMTVLYGGSAHAMLYSARGRQRLVRDYSNDTSYKVSPFVHYIFAWLHDTEMYAMLHALAPLKPCAVQSHPFTENQKEWRNVVLDVFYELTNAREDGTTLYECMHLLGRYCGGCFSFILIIIALLIQLLCCLCKLFW